MKKIIVSKKENSQIKTINDGLTEAENFDEVLLFIENGVYYEKLDIKHRNIHLEGESREKTLIIYDDYANKLNDEGDTYGTFRSYTVNTSSDVISLKNLTIKNLSGIGTEVGQAVALSLCAKNAEIINCNINAYQDTVFMSPFPPSPLLKDGFKGATDTTPILLHKNYFENCFISGDIDFIFGGGIGYFLKCEIYSNDLGREENGFITAASTYEGMKYGFVFESCKFTSKAKKQTVYLGRPWRNFAKTVFLRCDFGGHIKPVGYHNWDKFEAENTVLYAEYKCFGEGSRLEERVSFAKVLNDEEAEEYSKEKILGYKYDF